MATEQGLAQSRGGRSLPPRIGPSVANLQLSALAKEIHLDPPSLKQMVAVKVLGLFSLSLIGTLAFAAVLVLIDSFFIYSKIITPDQRLMTERIIMTFVTATVVQVGAAVASIVIAVFKTNSSIGD